MAKMKETLNSYIGDTIISVSYWSSCLELFEESTRFNEWHHSLLGVEIDFLSGRKLSISGDYDDGMGLETTYLKLNLDWDPEHVKTNMSSNPLFVQIINSKVVNIQRWWCNSLWVSRSTEEHPVKRYPQEIVIETENDGYLMFSSSETEGDKTKIHLFHTDEILLITDKKIAKKHQLAQYGKGEYERFKTDVE